MQIVLIDRGRAHELDVLVHDPDATVADLVAALAGGRTDVALEAQGTVLPGDRRLDRAGIRSGAPVRLVPAPPGGVGPAPGAPVLADGPGDGLTEVAVVGGLDAGARAVLDAGTWPVGRETEGLTLDHDTVSGHHATLVVEADGAASLRDEGSLNGTWVGGTAAATAVALDPGQVARVGAVQIVTRRPVDDDRPVGLAAGPGRGGATVPFNRPPRPAPPEPPEPVDTPTAPSDSSGPTAIGIMSILGPLVFGVAMVAITGRLYFALFILLSPVMIIGGAIDSRRRGKKTRRKDEARFRTEVDELAATLRDLGAAERARRADEVPDPAELLRRIEAPSTRLWERRPGHGDWLHLRAGVGSDAWAPPVHGDRRSQPDEVRDVIRTASWLDDAPVLVDLARGGVVGVVGPRPAALAVARSLVVQACTLHGPADLPTLVMAAPDHAEDWDWAKWLPHVLDPGGSGQRRITTDPEGAEARCRSLLEAAEARRAEEGGDRALAADGPGPATLVVVDDEALTEGRRAPARSVLRGAGGRVAGVVVAATEDRLPALCTTVVEVTDEDGRARVHHVRDGLFLDDVLGCGVSDATARRAARGLARFDDPELDVAGAGLPPIVALLPLLGMDDPTPAAVAEGWAAGGRDPDLVGPVGVSEDGTMVLDLVRDGPHGLVAGTTGSGKSELLRSLVAGLAARSSPDHCTFVLVDFKGGSAFDRCARLPHTVGMVTDLDAHLAERALRCLEAELRHRERVLRDAGAADLPAYRRLDGDHPTLPRLVVVIDEFATLKAELPDFVESLVGVAQRGRSLGVHMVLATQRPSGAVSENIKANTNLRIALRVQDAGDSNDVIDVPDAARIGRAQPGRALARFGPGEVVPLQTALSTGVSRGGSGPVEVRPFRLGLGGVGPAAGVERTEGPSDLSRLVDACREAHRTSGRPDPRRPWPDPLPGDVDLGAVRDAAGPPTPFGEVGARVAFTLADVPDEQTQVPAGWVPADGNLLLAGLPGSGTTTGLLSVALAAARTRPPDDLHIHALDFGTGELDALAGLPHVGAVVPASDRERQARLVTWLRGELDRRRGLRAPRATEARILVLLDGVGPFRAEWDEAVSPVLDGFARVFAEGPELGVHMAVSADRTTTLPAPLRGLVRQLLLFRLGDDLDYSQAGFRTTELPEFVPGRAVDGELHLEVQVARPARGVDAEVADVAALHPAPRRPPAHIGALPRDVPVAAVAGAVALDGTPRQLPVGVSEATLGPAGFTLYPGEHALVAGPARSGKTTALAVAGTVARTAGWATAVVAARRSALGGDGDLGPVLRPEAVAAELPGLLDGRGADAPPLLLLVDDIDLVDADATMEEALGRDDVVVVGAGRADTLRGLYSHWSRSLRRSRAGLLLVPDVDLDGDLLSVRLPRRTTTPIAAGRGYLCAGGEVELVQVAQP
ncbi:FtsK/SpoIIIE domain-containing protein [Iamia majanohamensis]|uniref:FtsK/SpoIIIE domain-containing protein n=1 Tax=Iamia majanohamensis TaxID=467976 RepID=A0AAE9YB69_9ACTN|nr:FtsK/SpoIIIE domain-containing protein [Iamia majanohamensis]WCO67799.1 FtsK/SpoIIIE domain-containing protein [Iamia majanohamensis]